MQKIILLLFVLTAVAVGLNCSGTATGFGKDGPTEAYKRLYAAVKSKDTEAVKKEMSEKSIEFAKMAAAKNNSPIEKIFENGFTATTFSPTLPEFRDERIAGDQGALEVWNSKDSRWEDLPFVKENGAWKLAVGELFAGTFKIEDVGRGRAYREAEAANAAGKGPAGPVLNANAMSNTNGNTAPRIANMNPSAGGPAANASNATK
jgi:hypothetical protein